MDYVPLNQMIIFQENGATEFSVNINIINDALTECSERVLVQLQLASPTDPALARRIDICCNEITVIIEDDEGCT